MVLSKQEIRLLKSLTLIDGPMPVGWLTPEARDAQRRMRTLGLLYKRDPEFVQLTKLGRETALSSSGKGT
jgi:hypothetical protein